MKLIDKINISEIIKNHLNTLVNDNDKKPKTSDWFTFLIIPSLVTAILYYFKANIIIVELSIFVWILFNAILLIFNIVHRESGKPLKNRVVSQLLSNIAFAILLSIILVVFTIVAYTRILFIKEIAQLIVYFLLTLFLVTILMILKRMCKLFDNKIKEISNKDEEN